MIPLNYPYQVARVQVAQLVEATTAGGLTGLTTVLRIIAVSTPGAPTVTFVA